MSSAKGWALGVGDTTVRRLHGELVSYAKRRTGCSDVAEEIAQEVWLAARGFRGESSLRGYLFSIARRRVGEWYRVRRRREGVGLLSEPAATSMESLLVRADSVARLQEALEQVPEPFQQALRLWMTGMRGEAIAEALVCSPHTVRSRVFRGKAILLKKLRLG